MRPIGAWAMGAYADRKGRRAALALSVTLMCGGSLAIAAIPSYRAIGVGAPALLLAARLLQGLSVGGEYGASAVYLSEMAGEGHRGFWSSFQYVTLIAGQLLALLMLLMLQAVLTPAALEAWGWRVPFAVGGLLAIGVVWLRRGIDETASFTTVSRRSARRGSGAVLFRDHPREALTVIGLTAGGTLAFYAYTTYMQKFLVNTAGFGRETAAGVMTLALAVYAAAQPLAGALSDRIGRKPLMVGFGVLGALATVPIFRALEVTRSAPAAFLLVMAALLIVTGYTAINAVVKAELFPAEIRALGVAFPYAIANALFGGSAEYIALWFKSEGIERGFYWYVSGMIACSLIVYLRMPDTRAISRIDAEPAG